MLGWVSYAHRAKPGEFVPTVAEAAAQALDRARLTWADVAGMGVAIAGLVDSRTGMVVDSANLGWHGFALGPELSGRWGVPVVIENDVCASALAELAALPGGPVSPWLYVSVGTGIGACVVPDHAGRSLLCLNAGHVPVPGGSAPCLCGRTGCLETVASGTAFTRAAAARVAAVPGHRLRARAGPLTGKDVVDAARAGDPISLEVLAAAGEACGHAVANLVNLMFPAGVGLAGGMVAPGSPYLAALLDAARHDIPTWMQEKFEFHYPRLGDRAGVIGAVQLAQTYVRSLSSWA
jgi:glucokinase